MIRIALDVQLAYEIRGGDGADFVFSIHAAKTPHQRVLDESLVLSQAVTPDIATDPCTGTRYMRLHADPGPLHLPTPHRSRSTTTVPTPTP